MTEIRYVKVTKLKEAPDPRHPNNIPVGNIYYGVYLREPVIGERFDIGALSWERAGRRGLSTSGVQEIIDQNTFRTYNSIYRWEYINKADIPE